MTLDKKTLEGIIGADTSTAAEPEEESIELSNTTVPTPEEEDNANISTEPEGDTETDSTSNSELVGDSVIEDVQPSPEDITADYTPPSPEENADSLTDVPTPVAEAEIGDGADANAESNLTEVEPEGVSEAPATKTFTQSQVDEIAGKIRKETREKVTRDLFSRYGVNTSEELDDLFGDAQRFATLQDDFAGKEKAWKEADDARNQELNSVKERVALLESGIDKERFEDARLILRGKGLEVTAENIEAELATHPEWKKANLAPNPVAEAGLPFRKVENPAPAPDNSPASQISIPTLGNNSADNPQPELSERERALRMFKV